MMPYTNKSLQALQKKKLEIVGQKASILLRKLEKNIYSIQILNKV
jgi:hypothetical protein